jgi:hypothetical protein
MKSIGTTFAFEMQLGKRLAITSPRVKFINRPIEELL